MVKIHFAYFKEFYRTDFNYFWGYRVIGVGESEFEVGFAMTILNVPKIELRRFSAFLCNSSLFKFHFSKNETKFTGKMEFFPVFVEYIMNFRQKKQ